MLIIIARMHRGSKPRILVTQVVIRQASQKPAMVLMLQRCCRGLKVANHLFEEMLICYDHPR